MLYWIRSAPFDSLFILAPAFIAVALTWILCTYFQIQNVSPLQWLILVVGIDVAHVYSTLYKTYFKESERQAHPFLYWMTPLLVWMSGVFFYKWNALYFWRILAYLAVFHFIRQAYGFFKIYSRNEKARPRWIQTLESLAIYSVTLYPLLYWHLHLPTPFQWMIEGDFFTGLAGHGVMLEKISGGILSIILLSYATCEGFYTLKNRSFNWPKNLFLIGTAGAWFTGILWLKNDFSFTLTNIVAHGIPYIALIWAEGQSQKNRSPFLSLKALPIFLGLLWLLAYAEEWLWDLWVWHDHAQFFYGSASLNPSSHNFLNLVVPLLAVPQATHYILDGFIWRRKHGV